MLHGFFKKESCVDMLGVIRTWIHGHGGFLSSVLFYKHENTKMDLHRRWLDLSESFCIIRVFSCLYMRAWMGRKHFRTKDICCNGNQSLLNMVGQVAPETCHMF